ncbi:MAG: response regulator, partial [Planctomycetota bacterium]|nr:response regulator [Planctomycetota bacterium]
MRILRFLNHDGQVMLGEDNQDGKATVLFDGQGLFGPRQDKQAARALLSGLHAIVADDDECICQTVRSTLEKFDCRCTTCRDGAEAIEAIQQLEFDLVVSDIVMPHHDGYEIFAMAKKRDSVRPVVLITGFGYDPGHAVVKATQEGLDAVLYKPFSPSQLIEKIANAVQTSKNGSEMALTRSAERVSVARILAPAALGDVICAGRNYRTKNEEISSAGDELELFMKPRGSLLDPNESIRLPLTEEGVP